MIENNATTNRLYRSRRDRVVAGVAGGIGHFLNLDPVLVRIAFVVLALTPPGIGLIAYIIMAVVTPLRPVGEPEPRVPDPAVDAGRSREIAAYALVGLGILLLAGNLGLYRIVNWGFLWPLVLVGVGVYLIARQGRQ